MKMRDIHPVGGASRGDALPSVGGASRGDFIIDQKSIAARRASYGFQTNGF